MKIIAFLLLLFISFNGFSQIIKGKIIDETNNQPIPYASVYINGSSYGVISNDNGEFELDTKGIFQPQVIISIINYQLAQIENPRENTFYTIKLKEKIDVLKEVVLEANQYSRASKMKLFKEHFIGNNEAFNDFKILNEDAINLNFDHKSKKLYANANEPLKIKNGFLGYEVTYDLQDFEIIFTKAILNPHYINQTYYAGTTFFKDISKGKDKYKKRREKAYLGSSMHFLQSLYEKKLKENNFRVYHKGFETNVDFLFERRDSLEFSILKYLKEREMVVTYNDLNMRTDIHILNKGNL